MPARRGDRGQILGAGCSQGHGDCGPGHLDPEMNIKSDQQARCHVLSEHFALTLSTTLFSRAPWQLETGLGKEYLHHRNQHTPQIRAVSLQAWLLIISQNTTEDWGASMGTWDRAHAQLTDWATLPWWDFLPHRRPGLTLFLCLKYTFLFFVFFSYSVEQRRSLLH